MASIHPLIVRPSPLKAIPNDSVAYAARDIQGGALDLMRAVEQAQTVSEALQLFALATTLRQELDRVVIAALDMADTRCGA